MIQNSTENFKSTTTSSRLVLPFYGYASVSFLLSALLLLYSTRQAFTHHFHPELLAIVHLMALGWGTMIILGASHQLVPVITENTLPSSGLALSSFYCAALGIPCLVYGFFTFNMGLPAISGGILINLAILAFLINTGKSFSSRSDNNIQSLFVFTATLWLLLTTFLGLALVLNFRYQVFSQDSLHYLNLHAHLGIAGWFLLMIIGVGSKLIPMFLISKYENNKLLNWIYVMINSALIAFILLFNYSLSKLYILPAGIIVTAIVLFIFYCYKSFSGRIRRSTDQPVKISLLAIIMIVVPVFMIIVISLSDKENIQLKLSYGFSIFFGWLTAIILGMTFKTLPFIIWNKIYQSSSGTGITKDPKTLFNEALFTLMGILYFSGFTLFLVGLMNSAQVLLKAGALLILFSAILYNWNVFKLIFHKG